MLSFNKFRNCFLYFLSCLPKILFYCYFYFTWWPSYLIQLLFISLLILWTIIKLSFIFRICENTCFSLWGCWFQANFWARFWFRVSQMHLKWSSTINLLHMNQFIYCSIVHFCCFFSILPLNWTVGMAGILAGTVEDALIT